MNNRSLPIIIGFALIVLVGGFVYWQSSQNVAPVHTGSNSQNTTGATGAMGNYTMSDVATHKDATSCWTVIDGSVYDLTQWIDQHPGGPDAIISICGIDGSSAFHGQHGSNPRQENILATFKIGTLSQ